MWRHSLGIAAYASPLLLQALIPLWDLLVLLRDSLLCRMQIVNIFVEKKSRKRTEWLMELMAQIADKIKHLRISLGLSQSEVARKLKVTPNTISRWESGEYKPRVDDLNSLAHIFGVSILEFFPDEQARPDQRLQAMFRAQDLEQDDIDEIRRFMEYRLAQKNMKGKSSAKGRTR